MVPVLNREGKVLFPCKERRARCLMAKGKAKPYWQKGIFCIKLIVEESVKDREYPDVALGIDPGSKREGYTVATEKQVVLNITTNTPSWIKDKIETRRNLRRSRRQRKTPYRKCRSNKNSKQARLPPSTKARWNAKLRIISLLMKILPITLVNVEDISAKTKKGISGWNRSFSPLEVGKKYFYKTIEKVYPQVDLILTKGFETSSRRKARGLEKSKSKLDYTWEAHNVDSHILCEMSFGQTTSIPEHKGIYKVEFIEFSRRQLHVQNFAKGGIRKQYGGTVSLGISRGSIVRYKERLVYIGGTSKGRLSIHSVITGKRLSQNIKIGDIEVLYNNKRRVQFLPRLKSWVSLHIFS